MAIARKSSHVRISAVPTGSISLLEVHICDLEYEFDSNVIAFTIA